ncbi:hypothetical protein N7519_003298 [Penicillium mononematosum]|uniref:uncharacterized protein n=1 Tax=Penicillium mononematosum TaxID=268346 RepID=UPI002547DDD2|nr:uncharacterized protein N7519_003298 [Penicillium mononematosum]KAJ6188390.1 hypothetical protein N7519_003298 [Penicillium mononematosum]
MLAYCHEREFFKGDILDEVYGLERDKPDYIDALVKDFSPNHALGRQGRERQQVSGPQQSGCSSLESFECRRSTELSSKSPYETFHARLGYRSHNEGQIVGLNLACPLPNALSTRVRSQCGNPQCDLEMSEKTNIPWQMGSLFPKLIGSSVLAKAATKSKTLTLPKTPSL